MMMLLVCMEQSLVMAAQPPTYVFPEVAFDMRVKVVNEQKAKVTEYVDRARKMCWVAMRMIDTDGTSVAL